MPPLSQFGADSRKMLQQMQRNLSRAMKQSAAATETHYKGSFRKGGFADDSSKWAGRRNPEKGKAVLVQSGDLRRSISAKQSGPRSITISSDVPYAEIHNEGGTIIQTPTFKQRMFFSAKSDEARKKGNKAAGNKWAAMSRAKQLTINIPQRQFMPIQGQNQIGTALEKKIYDIVKKNLDDAVQ
jgi:phage gpG-like protein